MTRASAHFRRGELAQARVLPLRCVELHRQLGETAALASALTNLAAVCTDTGRFADAVLTELDEVEPDH